MLQDEQIPKLKRSPLPFGGSLELLEHCGPVYPAFMIKQRVLKHVARSRKPTTG